MTASETNQIGELVRTIASLALVAVAAVIGGILWTVAAKLGFNPFDDQTDDTLLDRLLERLEAVDDDGLGGDGL